MKLPSLFRKKKAPLPKDADLDDDLEREEAADEENLDDLDGEPAGTGSRKRLFLLGGSGTAVLALVLGGWLWLGGGPQKPAEEGGVVLDIPPRPYLPPESVEGGDPATPTLNALASMIGGPDSGVVAATVNIAAYAEVPLAPPAEPLPGVPDAALIEQTSRGPLPRISPDGREPWRVYARPAAATPEKPRIAIIVGGLGLSEVATEVAIQRLPPATTLAFSPYGASLDDWVPQARNTGHEFLLEVPQEPAEFPARDPGPLSLMALDSPQKNLERAEFLMTRMTGYVGLISVMGSNFSIDPMQMHPFLDLLKRRGILYVDRKDAANSAGPSVAKEIGLPWAAVDLALDDAPSANAIDAQLADLESLAHRQGTAVGIAGPYPVTLARLAAWSNTLKAKGIALVPVSDIAAINLP